MLAHRIEPQADQMIALGFEGEATAGEMLNRALDWHDRALIKLEDAVVVSRGQDTHVKIHQTKTLTGKYALKGGGIGFLAGLLIGGPVGGMIAGAAAGAIAGKRKDIGIDDHIIKEAGDDLRPDSSILFLMGKTLNANRLSEELNGLNAVVVTSTLSEERQSSLMQLLGGEKAEEA
jgi:uncharacterized membrane protein